MNDETTVVDGLLIHHAAFDKALKRLERCYLYSANKSEAEGLAIIGPSGAGKTSVLKTFMEDHNPTRTENGMKVPILFVSVPSGPTVKNLVEAMIAAIGTPDPGRGTLDDKTIRLRELMKRTGTRMIMLDEFQHFYDRGKRQIMTHAADWLKTQIDATRATIVVSGLPDAQLVIEENVQLERRFLAPIRLPKFSWWDVEQREEFILILEQFHQTIAKEFETLSFQSEEIAYQFWCVTDGMIAGLSKLLRCALRDAIQENRLVIRCNDLAAAREATFEMNNWPTGLPKPFERDFKLLPTLDILSQVGTGGTAAAVDQVNPLRAGKKPGAATINHLKKAS